MYFFCLEVLRPHIMFHWCHLFSRWTVPPIEIYEVTQENFPTKVLNLIVGQFPEFLKKNSLNLLTMHLYSTNNFILFFSSLPPTICKPYTSLESARLPIHAFHFAKECTSNPDGNG
ncbi:unnamed protein product [Ilex paraguariensis]|uniref:Uncharacterized protein n=1 Tax=Ilex paraguariensis TaxID=185542 RepID=A0ABC8T4Z3_9AQUA